jgi:hypothetical protein
MNYGVAVAAAHTLLIYFHAHFLIANKGERKKTFSRRCCLCFNA